MDTVLLGIPGSVIVLPAPEISPILRSPSKRPKTLRSFSEADQHLRVSVVHQFAGEAV